MPAEITDVAQDLAERQYEDASARLTTRQVTSYNQHLAEGRRLLALGRLAAVIDEFGTAWSHARPRR